ncbi:GAF domain-containing protein [Pseudomonas kribbensis]|uniref:GAF domain-containing protein n=1 Tax=Pseudomonas kribbensis TaxID=1628086 RepID=UPI001ABF3EFA|nr:GAF domain-containing protein [Pseudomonas kribbensis]
MSNASEDVKGNASLRTKVSRFFSSKMSLSTPFTRKSVSPKDPFITLSSARPKQKDSLLAGALGAALVAFIGVIAASAVSIYSSKVVDQGGELIKQFTGELTPPESWELKLTLLLIGLAILVIYFRERALGEVVNSRVKEFQDSMSTLPPQNFLDVYSEAIRQVGDVRRNTKILYREKTLTSDSLENSIRGVLKVVLGLAKLWDGVASEKDTMVYRANIMIVIHPDSMESLKTPGNPFESIITESPFFLYRDNLEARLDYSTGLLVIENSALTTRSNVVDRAPDDMVKPLCLPFSTQVGYVQPNLPGAPEGVVNGSASYVGNTTKEITKWLDGLSTADPRYHKEYARGIRNYYENRREAQSILSMPIELEGEIIAMLNVYRNKDDIFKGEERARQFVALMKPICYQLSKMLKLASELD